MPIQVLPPDVAGKIAAGEVVERPASAAKELLENAIDAGATDIKVEIRQGGKRLIRVVDDGSGIPPDQVELAFARHSTSKRRTAEDLDHVTTLGFRGEALASIAAVSQITMATRVAEDVVGTRVRIEGGQLLSREGQGGPVGTIITVENLYYNTPARRKFLRTDATEAARISEVVTSYALAYPELRITLVNNGRITLQTLGTGVLGDVLLKTHGLDTAQRMVEFEESGDGISISGYVSAPSLHRSNRKGLLFFVNRRWVYDRSLAYAVEEAYHDLMPARRYPLAVIDIRLDSAEVDVNIHPTKREVRFRDGRKVFTAVQRAVRHALLEHAPVALARGQATPVTGFDWRQGREGGWQRPAQRIPGQMGLELQRTVEAGGHDSLLLQAPPATKLPMLRVVGQLAQTYIIAEGPGGMYLIDQHAAHERVIYEQMMADRQAAQTAIQALLEPEVIELSPSHAEVLEEHLDQIKALGFDIEAFGVNTYRVRAVPASLRPGDVAAAIVEMLEQPDAADRPWEEEALITVVCHGAVRAGKTLSMSEMRDLIRQLEATTAPHSCPHGRPTMIHLSAAQLEREFGRR